MTTLNTILVESVKAVITENGFYDADVEALRDIAANGVELTSVECLMLAMDHIAGLAETMSIMTELYNMVGNDDPHLPFLREMMTHLHAKRVGNIREQQAEFRKSSAKADSKVFAASMATSLAQKNHDIAAQDVELAKHHTTEAKRKLEDALAAQLAHLNCA